MRRGSSLCSNNCLAEPAIECTNRRCEYSVRSCRRSLIDNRPHRRRTRTRAPSMARMTNIHPLAISSLRRPPLVRPRRCRPHLPRVPGPRKRIFLLQLRLLVELGQLGRPPRALLLFGRTHRRAHRRVLGMRQRGGHEAEQGDEQYGTVHLDILSLTRRLSF